MTTEILSNIFLEIQTEYMSDLHYYVHNDVISENKMRAVKRISEICVMINQGDIFKEFIDLYKKSYFNQIIFKPLGIFFVDNILF